MKTQAIATACACQLFCGIGNAQEGYPAKPITLVVAFAAGSGTDIHARTLTAAMSKEMPPAQFVIENRPGANGVVAARYVAGGPGDGYTLLMTTQSSHSAAPYLYKNIGYDPIADFVAVGLIAETAPTLLTAGSSKANSVRDVVAQAMQKPGGLNFGSINTSSLAATQLFAQRAGVKVEIINYKSATQASTDLVSGAIDYLFGGLAITRSLVQSGKLKALAVLRSSRVAAFPQIPTMAEAGFTGMEVTIWIGMFAPKGTPSAIVERVNRAMNSAQKRPEMVQTMDAGTLDFRLTTPREFADYVAEQQRIWEKLVKDFDIKAD